MSSYSDEYEDYEDDIYMISLIETGLFWYDGYGKILQLKGTKYYFVACKCGKNNHWTKKGLGFVRTEDMMLDIPDDVRDKILFHLDVIVQ